MLSEWDAIKAVNIIFNYMPIQNAVAYRTACLEFTTRVPSAQLLHAQSRDQQGVSKQECTDTAAGFFADSYAAASRPKISQQAAVNETSKFASCV